GSNVSARLIALLYRIYAMYASGKDAVMGGMLVLAVAYVVWGFLAPRFTASSSGAVGSAAARGAKAAAMAAVFFCAAFTTQRSAADTLDHIMQTGQIRLGYLDDARPFTFKGDSGTDGYGAALCKVVAEQVKTQLSLSELKVEWVPVSIENALREVRSGGIDILCTPASAALTRRQDAAF